MVTGKKGNRNLPPEAVRELLEKLGPTGRGADPNIPGDRGEVSLAVGVVEDDIRIDFGTELSWIRMPKEKAIQFAHMIIAMAEKEDD